MLSTNRSIDLAATDGTMFNKSLTEKDRLSTMLENLTASVNREDRDRPNQTMTFNINGAKDPKAVADEVSSILQHEIDRRNAVWV